MKGAKTKADRPRGKSLRFVAAFAILVAPCPLVALAFDAELGLGGACALGRWAPLWISWEGAPADASIEVTSLDPSGGERTSESFPGGNRGRIECPVLVDSTLGALRVQLSSAGEILAEKRMNPRAKAFPGHILLSVDLPPEVQRAMAKALEPVEPIIVVSLSAQALPSLPLDLDAVAGIAFRDPGKALSPSQLSALSAWMASGGRAVILGARSGGTGLSQALGAHADQGLTRLGLGSVEAIRADPSSLAEASGAAYWRSELGLEPFGTDSRLSPGRLAALGSNSRPALSPAFGFDPAILAAFALWALIVAVLVRRKRGPMAIALLSALLAAAALPAAAFIDASRRGLSSSSSRLVVLEGGFALARHSLARERPTWRLDLSGLVPARPVSWSLGSDHGRDLPPAAGSKDPPVIIIHTNRSPSSSPSSGSPGNQDLISFAAGSPLLPEGEKEAYAKIPDGDIALAPAGKPLAWALPSAEGWRDSAIQPDFLLGDAAWLAGLRSEYPRLDFVVGRSRLPWDGPEVAGGKEPSFLWVIPFADEEGRK